MRRREFVALFNASVTVPFAALAQQPGRTYRLGVLLPHPRDVPVNLAFLDGFRRRGFIEGQNFAIEWRAYWQHFDLILQYAGELVKAGIDVIVAGGDEAIRALQQATKTIPIVALTDDMLLSGFANSVARPDGNITGVNILGREGDGKRQDILIEALPGLRRIAALVDVTTDPRLDALQEGARAHNIELSIYRIARAEQIVAAIDTARASGATAINVLSSALFWGNRQLIRDRVAALHLPAIYPFPEEAEEGGFVAYGPRLGDLFLEVMPRQIIQLFRGVKVADIPIEQPTKLELVINLTTAKALGLTIAESFLVRADKVIE
jgi:putative tryptophan/tyrosine transport system substrate-binding protein